MTNTGDEAARIIITATKLVDIRSKEFDCKFYQSNEDIERVERGKEWLPEYYLKLFLETLIRYPLKQVSIRHSIVNVMEVDHAIGSK